ncbi:MAG: Crp/Fnr family transcriptional regulator [Marinilabiliaceae bacterium]|nr:Crp/Fnr family transcriptional regulator [Marinilabiliaceae bacterium]
MKTITADQPEFICNISAPCFQMLTPEEMELVKASKTQVLFRKGDTLTKQGAFASYVLFIVDGLSRQYIEGESGRTLNLRIIQPGEFIGLSHVFAAPVYNYSSVAITECRAFLIDKAAIANVSQQNGTFAFHIIKRYCLQNANLYHTLQQSAFKQMNGRMADTLLYIDTLKTTHPDIFQYFSRKDIADFTGITTESAVKLLKSFEKDGLIILNEKDIILTNRPMLEEISKRG